MFLFLYFPLDIVFDYYFGGLEYIAFDNAFENVFDSNT